MKSPTYGLMFLAGCASGSNVVDDPPETTAALSVDTDAVAATIDERYLSVAVDMAQVVGGRF